jgi:hypothetical protein
LSPLITVYIEKPGALLLAFFFNKLLAIPFVLNLPL